MIPVDYLGQLSLKAVVVIVQLPPVWGYLEHASNMIKCKKVKVFFPQIYSVYCTKYCAVKLVQQAQFTQKDYLCACNGVNVLIPNNDESIFINHCMLYAVLPENLN